MFPTTSLLITLLLAISIAASPVEVRDTCITLPFVKRISTSGGSINLVKQDLARAATFSQGAKVQSDNVNRRSSIGSIPITNRAVSYIASVGVGLPPTTYDLLVDSGSSNTWVGADKKYVKTPTSKDTGKLVSVSYGTGSFSGEEWVDQITLRDHLVPFPQSIGVATTSTGMAQGVDGILGIGPVDLTIGTLTDSRSESIPTVTDNLFSKKIISKDLISVSFEPTTTSSIVNGELTFGGTDPSKYTGKITYVPITTVHPAARYWGIDQSITYGTQTILKQTAGIVDTGTSLILLATDAFQLYKSATGGIEDSATGLLKIDATQYTKLQSLDFHVGGTKFALTPNGQIWPRALNAAIGGVSNGIYLIVGDNGTPSGQGLDFLNGQTFLERFYSVFDTKNHRVGLATTPHTTSTIN